MGDNVRPKSLAAHYYLQSCQRVFFAKHLAGLTRPDNIPMQYQHRKSELERHKPFAQVKCQFNPPICLNPYNVGVKTKLVRSSVTVSVGHAGVSG